MASVNIPFGGSTVTVDVPDFAMEGTQQDVLEQASRQTDALQKIAASMGISIQNDRQETKSNKDLSSAIKKANSDEDKNFVRLNKNLQSMNAMRASSALNKSTGSESLSGLAGKDGILGAMGLTAMGAQIGTLFGIMEEFGSALGALRRTGGGLGVDLLKLRHDAANVGLDMQTLSKITVENGNAIRSLGASTTAGTSEFLLLNRSLREATRDMGFFGMGSKEMSTMLIDEIELRRATRNETFLEADARDQMVKSMTENLKLNEVMAGLTGQDVQDRIKARNEFRKNAIVAAAASKMTEKQLQSQSALVEGLSALGSAGAAGGPIQSALTNLIANVPMDKFNESFTQLSAAASGEGIDLRANLEEYARMVEAGADPKAMQSAAQKLVDQFANIDASDQLIGRAGAGQAGAAALLQTRMEAFASTTEKGKTVAEQVNDNMTKLEDAAGSASIKLTGLANQMGVAATEMKNSVLVSTLKAFNANPNSAEGLSKFVDSLENLPTTTEFKFMTDLVTEVASLASGAQGLMAVIGVGNEDKSKAEIGAETGLLFMALGKQLGINAEMVANMFGKGKRGATAGGKYGDGMRGTSAGEDIAGAVGTAAFAGMLAIGIQQAFTRNKPMPVEIIERVSTTTATPNPYYRALQNATTEVSDND